MQSQRDQVFFWRIDTKLWFLTFYIFLLFCDIWHFIQDSISEQQVSGVGWLIKIPYTVLPYRRLTREVGLSKAFTVMVPALWTWKSRQLHRVMVATCQKMARRNVFCKVGKSQGISFVWISQLNNMKSSRKKKKTTRFNRVKKTDNYFL